MPIHITRPAPEPGPLSQPATDVREALAVIVQYRIEVGQLVPMEPTDNFNIRQGVRRADDMIQLGLTEKEIRDLYTRVEELLRLVDIGRIETF